VLKVINIIPEPGSVIDTDTVNNRFWNSLTSFIVMSHKQIDGTSSVCKDKLKFQFNNYRTVLKKTNYHTSLNLEITWLLNTFGI